MHPGDLGIAVAPRRSAKFNYPPILLTAREWKELGEYSCTLPTGQTPGKMWKCHVGSHAPYHLRNSEPLYWLVGEYGSPSADGKTIAIHWYRPYYPREAIAEDFGING